MSATTPTCRPLVAINSRYEKRNNMRMRLTLLLLVAVVSLGCERKILKITNQNRDSFEVYNEVDYYKIISGKIKIIDTLCIAETQRAQSDIANKQPLTYYLLKGLSQRDVSNTELKELLAQNNIKFQIKHVPDMRMGSFDRYCYEKTFNSEIANRQGEHFIDSLRNIADRIFIESHPEFVFMWHETETTSRYSKSLDYSESLKLSRNDLRDQLQAICKKTGIEISELDVDFVIHRNGEVSRIKIKKALKPNTLNNSALIDSAVVDFVRQSKWNPGKFNGIDVNSEWHIWNVR